MKRHPDTLEYIKSRLDPSDFLTDFNRKLFERMVSITETGRAFDLVLLGDDFSPDEIGYVTKMLLVGAADTNYEKVLNDSIDVILTERKAADTPNIAELDDNAWADAMADIIKAKKK